MLNVSAVAAALMILWHGINPDEDIESPYMGRSAIDGRQEL
jgi:hypothetical protein